MKPHLVVGPPQQDGFCLVVAVVGRPMLGEALRNKFSVAFGSAAAECNAQHRLVNFDSSTLEIAQADVRNFLATLKAVLAEDS